jgi:hypothetical protein
MIATANDAVETLKHKRSGEVLATKKIARNTRLVYYADELVGLKLHDTIIAMYRPDGVTIDLRGPGSPNDQGWFTNVTLDRIATFTPARIERAGGLTWLVDPANGLVPYAHGAHVNPNGSCEMPIDPALLAAVARVVATYPAKLRRHADKIITAWQNWEQPRECCSKANAEQEHWPHQLDHFERGEVVIPPVFGTFMRSPTSNGGAYGDKLIEQGREELRTDLKELTQLAVKRLVPDFPYPQLTRTNGRN